MHLLLTNCRRRRDNVPLRRATRCRTRLPKYAMGSFVGLNPVVHALVVIEAEAIEVLTGLTAIHVSSSGASGPGGDTVILGLEGDDDSVRTAFEVVESIKGELSTATPEVQPAVSTR